MEHHQQARPTIAEIDCRALADNYAELVRFAGPSTTVLAVVKSEAYGHGLCLAARVLREAGADRFAVATTREGMELRASGIHGSVVVLGGAYPAEYADIVKARLTPVVWEVETARALAQRARAAGRVVALHVKVDTGMSRLGVTTAEAPELLKQLALLDGVTVEGLLTHLSNAESVDGAETSRQLALFAELVRTLEAARLRPATVHAANSAATLTAPNARFDMVRPGLALYGVYPSVHMRELVRLRPVMRFVTRIIAIRQVLAGSGVSYGATFVATRASRIATIPVGYADGYPRALSNRGVVVVCGARAPIAGRVCMDQTMIDVTAIPEAAVGDEVLLWGGDPLPVDEVARCADTIPYELMARIGARVPRVAA